MEQTTDTHQKKSGAIAMNGSQNSGNSSQQSIAPAPNAVSGAIRGPQHALPPQLLAQLGAALPVFPVADVISSTAGIAEAFPFGGADLFSHMNFTAAGNINPGLIPTNPFQHMAMASGLSSGASIPSSSDRKRERANSQSNYVDNSSSDRTRQNAIDSVSDRAKQNRDRNREHARSTRLRKKAYVAKLKDLVEGLHSQRTEDMRQRRVAIQHLSEVQSVRRNVIRTFLNYFCTYERDDRKWMTLIEEKFWLKGPVTPYRSFRRSEVEKECHVSKGLNSLMCNAASLSVMIEGIGSRSTRWMQLKRQEITSISMAQPGAKKAPPCLEKQQSRLHHAISSLSSNSEIVNAEDSTNGSEKKSDSLIDSQISQGFVQNAKQTTSAKVSSSSGSSNDGSSQKQGSTNVYHDYNAKPLPDPKLDEGDPNNSSENGSPEEYGDAIKQGGLSSDSSSAEDVDAGEDGPLMKKPKTDSSHQSSGSTSRAIAAPKMNMHGASIANKGGIPHNIMPFINQAALTSSSDRLKNAPAISLPPFTGLGKRSGNASRANSKDGVTGTDTASTNGSGAAVPSTDAESSSVSSDSNKSPRISAHFHINEDDMIMMDNVLMCPYVFRSSDAVLCGAVSECVVPGMLRAQFSSRNKLVSLELVYDAMGFMQQLERSSGNEGAAQIVPGSLEMALTASSTEARVITLAKAPFRIVNVNDVWTQATGYTQMEVEGKPYASLLDGEATLPPPSDSGRPPYDLEEVSKGRSACMTNIHYDKFGNDFIEFICSYPLTNANNETTHLLHVSRELPSSHSGPSMQLCTAP